MSPLIIPPGLTELQQEIIILLSLTSVRRRYYNASRR